MTNKRTTLILVPDRKWLRSAVRMRWALRRMADCRVWSSKDFRFHAMSLNPRTAVILMGDIPGSGLTRSLASKSGERFGVNWSVTGRVACLRPSLAELPREADVQILRQSLGDELAASGDGFGARKFKTDWNKLVPGCAARFLDESCLDPKTLPALPLHRALWHQRQWLHMGVAAFIAEALSGIHPDAGVVQQKAEGRKPVAAGSPPAIMQCAMSLISHVMDVRPVMEA